MAPETDHWGSLRTLLRDRLHLQPEPLLFAAGVTIPAASLWNGSRCWVSAYRQHGLVAGDTLAVRPHPCVGLLECVIAGLWHGLDVGFVTDPAPATVDFVATDFGIAGPSEPLHPSGRTSGVGLPRLGPLDAAGLLEAVTGCGGAPFAGSVVLVDDSGADPSTLVQLVLRPLLNRAAAVIWADTAGDRAAHDALRARYQPDVVLGRAPTAAVLR